MRFFLVQCSGIAPFLITSAGQGGWEAFRQQEIHLHLLLSLFYLLLPLHPYRHGPPTSPSSVSTPSPTRTTLTSATPLPATAAPIPIHSGGRRADGYHHHHPIAISTTGGSNDGWGFASWFADVLSDRPSDTAAGGNQPALSGGPAADLAAPNGAAGSHAASLFFCHIQSVVFCDPVL